MAAYVIADVDITDPEPYQEYRRRVLATVEAHGGRFLIRGGRHETLEGEWRPIPRVGAEALVQLAWRERSKEGPAVGAGG